ncbi:hypothetical protein SB861_37590 [Paraburkholderia sp. SIMBA_049]
MNEKKDAPAPIVVTAGAQDEPEAFDAWLENARKKGHSCGLWAAWQARAALTQPTAIGQPLTDEQILDEFERRAMSLRDSCGTPTVDGVRVIEGVRALLRASDSDTASDNLKKE